MPFDKLLFFKFNSETNMRLLSDVTQTKSRTQEKGRGTSDEGRFRPLSPVSCPKTQSYEHFSEHFTQSAILWLIRY